MTIACFCYPSSVFPKRSPLSPETDSLTEAGWCYCLGGCDLCPWCPFVYLALIAYSLRTTDIQLSGSTLPAHRGTVLFFPLPGMVHLRRDWNDCRCFGTRQRHCAFKCGSMERTADLNADSSSVTFRGHTSGSAFAGSSGRFSLSSPQFALL